MASPSVSLQSGYNRQLSRFHFGLLPGCFSLPGLRFSPDALPTLTSNCSQAGSLLWASMISYFCLSFHSLSASFPRLRKIPVCISSPLPGMAVLLREGSSPVHPRSSAPDSQREAAQGEFVSARKQFSPNPSTPAQPTALSTRKPKGGICRMKSGEQGTLPDLENLYWLTSVCFVLQSLRDPAQ